MSDTVPDASATESTTPPAEKKEDKGSALWREIRGLLWVLLAVLMFHSFVAKPFYIPSESMMPGLLTGDRLVVTKYPYGWSYVSPTIPNPVGIFRSLVLGENVSGGVKLPFFHGRLFGKMPERGDIVILSPPDSDEDYIKRVIGLPGDTLRMVNGQLYINGQAVKRQIVAPTMVPIDVNSPCGSEKDPALLQHPEFRVQGSDGRMYCRLPTVRETLPNGRSYDTVDLGPSEEDNFPSTPIPAGTVWLMGDNRDDSADSRVDVWNHGLGGPVPWENIGGRAEFITFSLDGTTEWWNPISWFRALRPGRAGKSLRNS